MEHLRPLRQHYILLIFGAFFIVLALAGIGYSATSLLSDSVYVSLSVAAGTALVGITTAAVILGKSVLASTEFLARAILHVSSESQTLRAPELSMVPASKSFFEHLSQTVYQMASGMQTNISMPHLGPDEEVISEPKPPAESEKVYKGLVDNSPLAILALDRDQKIKFLNQAAKSYTGISDESIGIKIYDAVKFSFAGDLTLDAYLTASENDKATDTHYWDRVRLTLPDGTVRQCDMSVHFSKDNPDGLESVIMLFDHTERYAKDDHGANFIGMAVHELRTPLTIMRGYIEVFEDEVADKLDPEQAEFMRNLSAQAQQLTGFVSNIQNFAKIEGSELSLELKSESWPVIVSGAVKDMELRARVQHRTLQVELAPDIPMVAVDRTTIYEVLVNLIENAIKYTHNDEPILIKAYKKDDNFVETIVEDKGIGIPEGLMPHLFEKFYRSHRSNRSVGGTGLGLYLSKAIVSAHGGDIWVKSHEGQGSTFGFTVPTLESVADQVNQSDNKSIVRGAHGWIKNHSLIRS